MHCCGDSYNLVIRQVEDGLGDIAEQNQVWKMKYSDLLQPLYPPTRVTFKAFIYWEAFQRQKQHSLILTYDIRLVNWRHLVWNSSWESKNAINTTTFLVSTANILSIILSQLHQKSLSCYHLIYNSEVTEFATLNAQGSFTRALIFP